LGNRIPKKTARKGVLKLTARSKEQKKKEEKNADKPRVKVKNCKRHNRPGKRTKKKRVRTNENATKKLRKGARHNATFRNRGHREAQV